MWNVCCKSVKHNLQVPEGSTLKYWLKGEPWAFYPTVLVKSSLSQSPNKCICTGLYHQIESNWMFYTQSTSTVTSGKIKSQENVLFIERMLCISFFKQNSTKRSSPLLAFDCPFSAGTTYNHPFWLLLHGCVKSGLWHWLAAFVVTRRARDWYSGQSPRSWRRRKMTEPTKPAERRRS